MNDPKLINPDNREEIPDPLKKSGFEVEQVPYKYLNELIFKNSTNHIWGTSDQVTNNDATFYTDGSGVPKDKNNDTVVLATDEKVLITHNTTLTSDLILASTAERLSVQMLKGATLDLGDSGGGVPYDFRLDINNARLCDIYTTEDFQDLSALTDEQQRVVKNRGEGNIIRLNNRQIFSGNRPIEIFSPIQIPDPYVISQNGFSFEGFKVSGSNDDVCLFTDWWKAYGGLDIVGDGTILIPPVFNPFSGSLQRKVFSDDPAGRFMRLNTPFGGATGVDPDVHSRTSPETLATITSYTSSASAEINDISDADAIKLKIGARVQATGLPSPTTNTTIISSIVYNSADDNSIFLIDSETGAPAVVSATGNLTIDMSGNSGISHQLDAMQRITGFLDNVYKGSTSTGVFSAVAGAGNRLAGAASTEDITFDNSGSTSPNTAKTDDVETRGISKQRQPYLIL